MTAIDVTECPDCAQKGRYEARILIGGRGVYTCPSGHRWQNADEKPSNKGVPLTRGLTPQERADIDAADDDD